MYHKWQSRLFLHVCMLHVCTVTRKLIDVRRRWGMLKAKCGFQNCVINVHKKIFMNWKHKPDTIVNFKVLAIELKSFLSVLLHYKTTSEYNSGTVVKEIRDRRFKKKILAKHSPIL